MGHGTLRGEKGFHSGPAILGLVGRGRIARYFGVLAILIPMVVYMYYVYIEAWCLRYAWEYLIGGVTLTGLIEEKVRGARVFFGQTTGTDTNGVLNMSSVFWLIVVALNIILVYRGLSGGIEKFCQFALPAMAVLGGHRPHPRPYARDAGSDPPGPKCIEWPWLFVEPGFLEADRLRDVARRRGANLL